MPPDLPIAPCPGNCVSPQAVDLMHCPGEIRNKLYDIVIHGLPGMTSINVLPGIAFVNVLIHGEFMTRFLPKSHFNITSMEDIWYVHTLVEMHSREFLLHSITRLTITNFTAIAHSQARASELMDCLCQFESLHTLSLEIVLDDLFHGLQGRVKSLEHLATEFELFQIIELGQLSTLVVHVKQNGIQLTPDVVFLLSNLEAWFLEGVKGDVVIMICG